MVQWLRLLLPMQGIWVQSLVRRLPERYRKQACLVRMEKINQASSGSSVGKGRACGHVWCVCTCVMWMRTVISHDARPCASQIFCFCFLAVLSLRCCSRAFSSCSAREPLLLAAVARASHHGGVSCCRARAPGVRA